MAELVTHAMRDASRQVDLLADWRSRQKLTCQLL
jgi:hypothetical protein